MSLEQRAPLALVVEDDPTTCSILGELLGEVGFEVMQTGSPRVALRLAREHQPAVILLDAMLGGEHARALAADLLDDLKGQAATRDIRVIALGQSTSGAAGDAQADAILPKPFSLAEVVAALRSADAPPDSPFQPAWVPS